MGVLPAAYAIVTIGGVAISNFALLSGNIVITNLSVEQLALDYIKYTVNMQYNPSTFEAGTPNNLEYFIKDKMDKGDNLVTIQFGYESNSPYRTSTSPIYIGMLYNFSTKVNVKSIDYTMEAFGKTSEQYGVLISGKISFDYKTNIKKFIESFNNNDALPENYGKHFVFKCEPNLGALKDFYPKSIFPNVPAQAGASAQATAMAITYSSICEVNDPVTGETKQLNAIYRFSVLSFLKCLVNKLNTLCNKDDLDLSVMKAFKGHQFALVCNYYSPGGGKYGTISIVDTKDTKNMPAIEYVFDYGKVSGGDSPNNHNVLNWNCDYNDTAIFYSKERGDRKLLIGDAEGIANNFKSSMETSGSTAVINGATAGTSSDSNNATSSNIIQNYLSSTDKLGNIKSVFNYPYEGSLEVLGNPDPIDICHQIITVVPRINGVAHHTAGKYLVTGVTHNINAEAFFTTTYKCIRVQDKDIPGGKISDGESQNIINQSKTYQDMIRGYRNPDVKDL